MSEKENKYLPGQLDFANKLFGLGPGKKKKELEPATVLDDTPFLFVEPGEDRDEKEDKDDWPLGEDL